MSEGNASEFARSNLWTDESTANCRLCYDQPKSAVMPLPICAACAWQVYNVMAVALGASPREQPADTSQRRAEPGHVYYIRRGNLIKIGFTVDLEARMRSHLPDEVLAIEPGTYQLEAERHRQFAAYRYAGNREWFINEIPLLQHINLIRRTHGAPPPLPTLLNR